MEASGVNELAAMSLLTVLSDTVGTLALAYREMTKFSTQHKPLGNIITSIGFMLFDNGTSPWMIDSTPHIGPR